MTGPRGKGKVVSRRQLTVEIWQVLVDGEKPTEMPGSTNDAVEVRMATP